MGVDVMFRDYKEIPDELKKLNHWCCFRLVWNEKKRRHEKIPFDVKTGEWAKSNDESTWCSFEEAMYELPYYDGLGFFFKPPYFGIDLDDVKEDIERYKRDDHEDNIVSEFIYLLESYAEYSVSGNGIHIIAKGKLPENGRRKGNVEMYDSGRFFAMTGKIASEFKKINDNVDEKIKYLHNKYIARNEIPEKEVHVSNSIGNQFTEDEIIQIAYKSKTGMRFKLFMEGGWEQFYTSQSEADLAFANDLAFWTNRDFHKMDSIFRRSSLYRPKYDEKRRNSTYGTDLLNKAISDCLNGFNPQEKKDDFNIYVLENDVQKVERKFYSYDDTGNAQRFKDMFGDVVRYSYVRKNWFFYNGKTWVIDQEGKLKSLADKVIEKMKDEPNYIPEGIDEEQAKKAFQKHLKTSRSSRGKTNMLKESEHLLPIQMDEFDKDPYLFNVQNGYLDLRTGKLHEHDKEKYFTRISSVEYTDKIDCPLWHEFLNQIFDNNRELIDYVQRAVGYSLSGSTEEQMMFILYGNGRNGKSVFLDIITEIFGSYSANIQPQTIMVKQQSSAANSDIARLDGARLVTTTEPNEGVRLDEGLVKQLTGGDKVTARFLYENEFDFIPQFKLWMATNHKPIIRGTDDGIWRRLAVIPFTVQIPEHKVDKRLKHKLRRELTAILNWAVEGYMMWSKEGLKEPQIIKDQRKEYRTEMDAVEAFIEDRCVRDDFAHVQAKTLYQEYREWAIDNNQYLMSNTKFGREMAKKFPKRKSNGVIVYGGIRLQDIPKKFEYTMNY